MPVASWVVQWENICHYTYKRKISYRYTYINRMYNK
jgi:hypothetical protein